MAGDFAITRHAAERFVERVEPGMSLDEARVAIRTHTKAIDAAFGIGCKCVRLGNHARLILDLRLRLVVTVLPAPMKSKHVQGNRCAFSASRRRPEYGEC